MNLQEMINVWILKGNLIFALDTWLDEMKRADIKRKEEFVQKEPIFNTQDVNHARYKYYSGNEDFERVFIAAGVEDCCIKYSVPLPSWLEKKEYYLSVPYYAWNTKKTEHINYMIANAPEHFKKRNLFILENSFVRV